MPGKAPRLKVAARTLARRQEALKLIGEGKSVIAVAAQMGVTVQRGSAAATRGTRDSKLVPEQLERRTSWPAAPAVG
jgi:hypothetical protein